MPDIGVALATAAAPTVKQFLQSVTKPKYDEFIALYTKAFNGFLDTSRQRCASVKTILNKTVELPLGDIYVNIQLRLDQNAPFDDTNLINHAKFGNYKIVVSGLAGSGKSMLMKWLGLTLIDDLQHHQRIPLFIEIRDLEENFTDLAETIFQYCRAAKSKCTLDQFKVGLREGIFILLLDGIDELPPDCLDRFLKSLQKFSDNFGKTTIIASSRPGTQVGSVRQFISYEVMPLDRKRVIEILQKAPYEESRKNILIKEMKSGLYKKHLSFLSNPLLVMIVLITFDDASKIPENLAEFYSAAFDALYFKHDWSKGVFSRKMRSKLEKSDFEKLFQIFCYISYFSADYSFSRSKAIELVDRAKESSSIEVSTDDYLSDCILSVCLLLVDEPKLVFVHRSFQEYFTARFVAGYSGPKLPILLDWIAKRSPTDGTFIMVAQMNRELVIRQWAMTVSSRLFEKYDNLCREKKYEKMIDGLGLGDVRCDLKTGKASGFSGKYTDDLRSLSLLNALMEEKPNAEVPSIPTGSIYGNMEFAGLRAEQQRTIRAVTRDDQSVGVSFRHGLTIPAMKGFVVNFLETLVVGVKEQIEFFENFIKSRDEIAELIDLVDPATSRKRRKPNPSRRS